MTVSVVVQHFFCILKDKNGYTIINGTGNYYTEAQTREQTRTDIIVDYLGKQYVIELKIWRGDEYNKRSLSPKAVRRR